MKKFVRIMFVFVFFAFSFAAYTEGFDWSKCWQNYGGTVSENNFIINAGAGLGTDVFENAGYDTAYRSPYLEASVEYTKKIGVLPFGFGGFFGYSSYEGSEKYFTYKMTMRRSFFDVGALVNYHIQLPVEKLDVYTGFRTGVRVRYDSVAYTDRTAKSSSTTGFFLFDYRLGASYYFTDVFGANLETGYPVYIKAAASFKF